MYCQQSLRGAIFQQVQKYFSNQNSKNLKQLNLPTKIREQINYEAFKNQILPRKLEITSEYNINYIKSLGTYIKMC